MKLKKKKIARLRKCARWKRILFVSLLNSLLLLQTVGGYLVLMRRVTARRARRVHWVGSKILEANRVLAAVLGLLIVSRLLLPPNLQSSLRWAAGWGLGFSIIATYKSLSIIVKRLSRVVNP